MGTRLHASAMGVKHIMLRKLDGAEALRRIQAHGVTYLCAAPAVVSALLDAAKTWEGKSRGMVDCASFAEALRRRPAPSSACATSSAGSSCRCTA